MLSLHRLSLLRSLRSLLGAKRSCASSQYSTDEGDQAEGGHCERQEQADVRKYPTRPAGDPSGECGACDAARSRTCRRARTSPSRSCLARCSSCKCGLSSRVRLELMGRCDERDRVRRRVCTRHGCDLLRDGLDERSFAAAIRAHAAKYQ